MIVRSRSNYWLLILARGVAAILLGIFALAWPDLATTLLIYVFGTYAFIDGILSVISGVNSRAVNPRWGLVLLEGLAGIVAGLLAFFLPGIAALTLIYLIAAWAIITGLIEIVTAIRLREEINNEWALALTGVLSILLGVILLIFPSSGVIAFAWILGIYALIFGALMLYLAFRIRSTFEGTAGESGRF